MTAKKFELLQTVSYILRMKKQSASKTMRILLLLTSSWKLYPITIKYRTLLVFSMGLLASIVAWFSSGEKVEIASSEEYETEVILDIIDAFSGYRGVFVIDRNGEELDPENLPPHYAADGGADCRIVINADKYTEQGLKWIETNVENVLDEILNS